jgi:hypothetical protein
LILMDKDAWIAKLRLRTDIDPVSGCWLWRGATTSAGYGEVWIPDGVADPGTPDGQRVVLLHRVAFEHFIGPIPAGFEVDHRCHGADPTCVVWDECLHRLCWNPEHLESVTTLENNHRRNHRPNGNTAKTHCDAGHRLEGSNLYIRPNGNRACRPCRTEASRRHRALRAA